MRAKLLILTTLTAATLLLAGFGADGGQGGGPPKPGPEHKVLEPLVGTWNAKIKLWMDPSMPVSESEGTMTRKWVLDGLFVQEDFTGKFAGLDFKGIGIVGYDPMKKKYVATWIDSMSTGLEVRDAIYDPKTKTLSSDFVEGTDQSGKKAKGRDTVRVVDNDHHVQEIYKTPEGGKEFKMIEIHYHRAKK